MDEKVWDENIWFAPCLAISEFRKLVSRIGISKTISCKKEFEAYIAGITLLGVIAGGHPKGKLWWLQIPKEDPPDALGCAMSLDKLNIGVHNIINIEVFQVVNNRQGTIIKAINSKLQNKKYDRATALVAFINRNEQIENLKALSEKIDENKPLVGTIWLVGNLNPINDEYLTAELYPSFSATRVRVKDTCAQWFRRFPGAIRVRRSTRTIGLEKLKVTPISLKKINIIPGGKY